MSDLSEFFNLELGEPHQQPPDARERFQRELHALIEEVRGETISESLIIRSHEEMVAAFGPPRGQQAHDVIVDDVCEQPQPVPLECDPGLPSHITMTINDDVGNSSSVDIPINTVGITGEITLGSMSADDQPDAMETMYNHWLDETAADGSMSAEADEQDFNAPSYLPIVLARYPEYTAAVPQPAEGPPSSEDHSSWALWCAALGSFYDIIDRQFGSCGRQLPRLKFATRKAAEHFALEMIDDIGNTHQQLLQAVQIRDPWYVLAAVATHNGNPNAYRQPVRLFSARDQYANWFCSDAENYATQSETQRFHDKNGLTFASEEAAVMAGTMLRVAKRHRVFRGPGDRLQHTLAEDLQVDLNSMQILEVRSLEFFLPAPKLPELARDADTDRPLRSVVID